MDEKTTTVANGNKDGKQERETRTVEVRVSTDNLGTMILKSLNSAEVCKAAGWEAPDIEDGGIPDQATVHFADSGRLQVFDSGRCILERDSLPTLDAYCLVEYAKVLHEHGEVTPDNFDRYEDFDEDEFPLYQSLVARAEGPEEEGGNAEWVRGFWKRVQTGKVPEKEGFMVGLLHHICDDLEKYGPLWQSTWDGSMEPPPILATVCVGGRGGVSFWIEIPQKEPFDINKLHFFCSPWWWDSPLGVHGDIGYMLELCSDTSLELIEYDGKIYCRGEADRAGGGFKNILIHADLKEFEPDWNLDGCAFEDLGVEVEDDEDDAWDEDEEDYEEEEEEEDEDEEEEEAADGDE